MARKIRTITGVEVIDIGDKGQAIGKCPDGRIVLVDKAVPGDILDVIVRRKRKGMLMTIPSKFTHLSEQRTEPFCKHFGICGGCKWQHLEYESQLRFKEQAVRSALNRIAHISDPRVEPIVGAQGVTHYRNKLEYTFTDQRWLTQEEIDSGRDVDRRGLGFHVPGSFARVLDLEECHLQADPSNAIRQFVRKFCVEHDMPFQNIRDRSGLMRNLIIRSNEQGECMVMVIFVRDEPKAREQLLDALADRFAQIVSLYYCINPKLNDSYFDLDFHCYHGEEKLQQILGHVRFLLGPKSFYQTNPAQARVLFDAVVEFADFQGTETVYDLYCGMGSITLYVARHVRQVIGIEEIPEAIVDARSNTALNGVDNVTFHAGDVKDILGEDFHARYGAPDVIITDPPRAGMHASAVRHLIELAPEKIVYVSCNPATQARDIGLLGTHFDLVRARPVDMFPHTSHIENVALLRRKQ